MSTSHTTKHPAPSPEKPDECGATTTTEEPASKRPKTDAVTLSSSVVLPVGKVGPVRQAKLTDFFTAAPKTPKIACCAADVIDTKPSIVLPAENIAATNNLIDVSVLLHTMQTEKHLEVHHSVGPTWFTSILQEEFQKPYFQTLSRQLAAERMQYKIFPPPEQIWTWTTFFDCKGTKVVIIGQDPYHGAGQAHGLCFSVLPNIAVPASLRNIYEELERDINGFKRPKHGCLRGWARQGVLLLNAVLTVRSGQANSHHKKLGWELLTDAVVNYFNKHGDNVVFMLWGQYAQAKCAKVDAKRHLVLKAAHPSPLAGGKFKGCKHFSQANKWLMEKGKKPIDWSDLTEL